MPWDFGEWHCHLGGAVRTPGGGRVGVLIYCSLLHPCSVLPTSHLAQPFFPQEQQSRQKNSSLGRSASIEMLSEFFKPPLYAALPCRPPAPLPHSLQLQNHHYIPLIVSDQTRQIGRRMVSQGNLGHRDGKGAEENIMAGAPLKHADSWQMSIHKMTKAPCVKISATSASPWETNCLQLSVKILFFFSGNYCCPWFCNHRIACTLHLWVSCILVAAATPASPSFQ